MLTDLQKTQFDVFGFVVLHGMLRPDQIEKITLEFEIGLADAEANTERQSFRKQLNWWNLRPDTPYMASLMEDAEFLGIARQLLGEDVVGSFSASNSFSGDRTDWHPDASQPHWRGLKFGIYLQPTDENTGALRLVPGSHKEPLHSDFRRIPLKESVGRPDQPGLGVEEVPAYIGRVEPGDVVVFHNYTWHASYGGGEDRRLVTMAYFGAPTTPEEEAAVSKQVEAEVNIRRSFPLLRRHPQWIANEEGSAVRQGWIDVLHKYGFIAAQDANDRAVSG